jgi:hypothetical protein
VDATGLLQVRIRQKDMVKAHCGSRKTPWLLQANSSAVKLFLWLPLCSILASLTLLANMCTFFASYLTSVIFLVLHLFISVSVSVKLGHPCNVSLSQGPVAALSSFVSSITFAQPFCSLSPGQRPCRVGRCYPAASDGRAQQPLRQAHSVTGESEVGQGG